MKRWLQMIGLLLVVAITAVTAVMVVTGNDKQATVRKPGVTDDQGLVTVCGYYFCLNGQPWRLYGASVYQGLDDPEGTVAKAKALGLNTLRITDFLETRTGSIELAAYDEGRWAKVDRLVAAADGHGLKIILDFSEYRNLLVRHGVNPYAQDWGGMLEWAMSRRNTASGRTYRDDTTFAYVELAGEVDLRLPENTALGVNAEQTAKFYERTLLQLAQVDPHHLHSAGGMSHLESPGGVDWRRIMNMLGNSVCAIHNYSSNDTQIVTPRVAAYCTGLGKPWLTEEFGFKQGMGDTARAAECVRMIALQREHRAAGVAFWNFGGEVHSESYDINLGTPKTYEVIRNEAT